MESTHFVTLLKRFTTIEYGICPIGCNWISDENEVGFIGSNSANASLIDQVVVLAKLDDNDIFIVHSVEAPSPDHPIGMIYEEATEKGIPLRIPKSIAERLAKSRPL